MRIALVIPHAETTRTRAAGRGEQISPLAEALARLGHEVTIYAPDDPKARPGRATAARGVTIRNLPAPVALPAAHGYPGDEARRVRSFSDQLARCWQQEPPRATGSGTRRHSSRAGRSQTSERRAEVAAPFRAASLRRAFEVCRVER